LKEAKPKKLGAKASSQKKITKENKVEVISYNVLKAEKENKMSPPVITPKQNKPTPVSKENPAVAKINLKEKQVIVPKQEKSDEKTPTSKEPKSNTYFFHIISLVENSGKNQIAAMVDLKPHSGVIGNKKVIITPLKVNGNLNRLSDEKERINSKREVSETNRAPKRACSSNLFA